MMDWTILEQTDWSRTFHAYALATDTPAALRSLAGTEEEFASGMDHLWGSILHQGTVYPATAPAVRQVCALLGELSPHRVLELLRFLHETGLSAVVDVGTDADTWADEPLTEPTEQELDALFGAMAADDLDAWSSPVLDYLWRRGIESLQTCGPDVTSAVMPLMRDADARLRSMVAAVLAAWSSLVDEPMRGTIAGELSVVPAGISRDELAARVLALGEVGFDVRGWLGHPDPAIRACAAIFEDGPAATRELITALRDPAAADGWFSDRPAQFDGQVRFSLLPALLTRGLPFSELLPVAVAIARVAGQRTVNHDWGLLLDEAFDPDNPPASASDLDEPQREFLKALLANDQLWDPTNGNVRMALKSAGLPEFRDGIVALVG